MADRRIKQPKDITWEELTDDDHGHHWRGEPSDDDDAYEQDVIIAKANCFKATLGCLEVTGDASDLEESRRFGEAAFRTLIDLGNRMSAEHYGARLDKLSPRERELVEHLRSGKRLNEIAVILGNSIHTIRNHTKHIFRKVGVRSQVELLAVAGGTRG